MAVLGWSAFSFTERNFRGALCNRSNIFLANSASGGISVISSAFCFRSSSYPFFKKEVVLVAAFKRGEMFFL